MISTISIISMCITLIVTLILPLLLYVGYGIWKNKNEVWLAGILGAVGFSVLQLGIRIPILNKVAQIPSFSQWISEYYIWYCLILAFTAGLFEVIGRYAVAKILCWKKKVALELTYETGIAAGIGHGGIEAVLIVGMTYINNLLFTIMINTGEWESMLAEIKVAAEQMGDMSIYQIYETIPQQLIDTPWYLYLAAGYERILTIIAHIAMTLIVFYFVSKKKDLTGILICLLCHTMLDFVSAVMSGLATDYMGNKLTQNTSYICIYLFLTIVAAVSAVFLVRMGKVWRSETPDAVCEIEKTA